MYQMKKLSQKLPAIINKFIIFYTSNKSYFLTRACVRSVLDVGDPWGQPRGRVACNLSKLLTSARDAASFNQTLKLLFGKQNNIQAFLCCGGAFEGHQGRPIPQAGVFAWRPRQGSRPADLSAAGRCGQPSPSAQTKATSPPRAPVYTTVGWARTEAFVVFFGFCFFSAPVAPHPKTVKR